MKTVMVMLAFGSLGAATIGLLLLAIGFLSGWDWPIGLRLLVERYSYFSRFGVLCFLRLFKEDTK